MSARRTIVLMDKFGTVDQIERALVDQAHHFTVVAADVLEPGQEAFALLIGPETPVGVGQIESIRGLKIVAVTSTGFDHVPVAEATRVGVWVTSSAGYCTDEVAEHALALVLGGLRRIAGLDSQVRAGGWDVTQVAPKRIRGSRVGLLGFGRISQALAIRLVALGVTVTAYDPVVPDAVFATLGVRRSADAAGALQQQDVISLHVPLLPSTAHVVNATTIAAMLPGTFVVNVARGGLVDLDALGAGLHSGHLSGAGLDVFEEEPLPSDAPIRSIPNVLLGPHGAWYSEGAEERLFTLAVDAILDVFNDRTPRGVVAAPRA